MYIISLKRGGDVWYFSFDEWIQVRELAQTFPSELSAAICAMSVGGEVEPM